MWGKAWDEADPAYREFDWVVLIYGIDANKFMEQCHKFDLEDAGIGLADMNNGTVTKLPKLVLDAGGGFTVHLGGLIAYKGREIGLQRQESKIAAYIIENAVNGQYITLENIADNCLSEAYLEKAGMSGDEALVNKYLWRCLYDIRTAFRAAASNKDYFPLKRGIGYTFAP
ncbi:hypothetical protein JNJ66_02235 [Candidatus Saccharibacteria bacterium]|nr:hypothetical protein [Candidatus Saccharibacteria bacterium]